MHNKLSITTGLHLGNLPLFSLRYRRSEQSRTCSLIITYGEDEHDCIVFRDASLLAGPRYETRDDGIWFDAHCEIPGEHWSISLESFALRLPTDEYLSYREDPDNLLIGDRIPFGFELDAITRDGDSWELSGDIYIEKSEIALQPTPIKFSFA